METNHHVQKILFEHVAEGGAKTPRAMGVLLTNTNTGEVRKVYANKEIILSAGAIGSPHILQCSGIGDPELLSKHGVGDVLSGDDATGSTSTSTSTSNSNSNSNSNHHQHHGHYVNSPGVGQNLQDHLQIRSVYQLVEGTVTLNSWKKAGSLLGQAALGIEYALFQTGPLSMAPSQFGLFAE